MIDLTKSPQTPDPVLEFRNAVSLAIGDAIHADHNEVPIGTIDAIPARVFRIVFEAINKAYEDAAK